MTLLLLRKLSPNTSFYTQADYVSKALVTYQDKYDRIKRQFQRFELNYVGDEEGAMEIESLKHELRGTHSIVEILVDSASDTRFFCHKKHDYKKHEAEIRKIKKNLRNISRLIFKK